MCHDQREDSKRQPVAFPKAPPPTPGIFVLKALIANKGAKMPRKKAEEARRVELDGYRVFWEATQEAKTVVKEAKQEKKRAAKEEGGLVVAKEEA
jgi:hypothetical protein